MGRRWIPLAGLVVLALAAPAAAAAPLARPDDPVVITGAGVPVLNGAPPGRVVAFAWSGSWQQIPVQVDERKLVDLRLAYPNPFSCGANSSCYAPFSTPAKLRYADAGTRIGADSNANLDADDEIAFMAKDAGSAAGSAGDPAGVVAGSRAEIVVTDPLDAGRGYVYLFRSDGSLDPAAGQTYVTYSFNLASGPYLSTYKHSAGSNTETSSVLTPYYSRAFSDRWLESELRVLRGERVGRRRPRSQREPVLPRLLRALAAHVRPGRGRLPHEPERARARDPLVPRREQRPDDRAPADLLRGPGGGHDLPARPQHPRGHELSRLQRRRVRDDLPQQQQPRGSHGRRRGRQRGGRAAHLGEHRRAPGSRDERAHLEHHGRTQQVHLVLPRLGKPAGRADALPGRRGLLRRERALRERLDRLHGRAVERDAPRRTGSPPPGRSSSAPRARRTARSGASRSSRA